MLRPLATSGAKDYKGHSLVQTSFTEPPNTRGCDCSLSVNVLVTLTFRCHSHYAASFSAGSHGLSGLTARWSVCPFAAESETVNQAPDRVGLKTTQMFVAGYNATLLISVWVVIIVICPKEPGTNLIQDTNTQKVRRRRRHNADVNMAMRSMRSFSGQTPFFKQHKDR